MSTKNMKPKYGEDDEIIALYVIVSMLDNKDLKAKFVQEYVQKHGPLKGEYADKIKEMLEETDD